MNMSLYARFIKIRIQYIYRLLFMSLIANRDGSVLVTEYPKSGGTWLSKMISETIGLDFPRNRVPSKRNSVFHGHLIRKFRLKSTVVLWRDPKDIVISYYHHAIVGNSHSDPQVCADNAKRANINREDSIQENLIKFIHFMFSGDLSPRYVNWCVFFDRWYGDRSVFHVRYEDLLVRPQEEMLKLFAFLGREVNILKINEVIEGNSFEKATGRSRGTEDQQSFVRKGIAGDWKNYFDENSLKVLSNYLGGRDKLLGY